MATTTIKIDKTPAPAPVPSEDTAGILDMIRDLSPVITPAPGSVGRLDLSRRCRLAVYVPSTVQGDQPVGQSEFTDRTDKIGRILSRLFGGATVTPAAGYYIEPDSNRLIYERINIVTSHVTKPALTEHLDTVIKTAKQYRDLWQQTSIALGINDTMILI